MCEKTQFHLSAAQITVLNATSSKNIKLGVRPEFVELTSQQSNDTYPAEIVSIESFGAYQLVSLNIDQQQWFARIAESEQPTLGATHIRIKAEHLKLYIDEYLAGETPCE